MFLQFLQKLFGKIFAVGNGGVGFDVGDAAHAGDNGRDSRTRKDESQSQFGECFCLSAEKRLKLFNAVEHLLFSFPPEIIIAPIVL